VEKRPVTLIVDGAIELAPERLEALPVCVVPREAKVGREKRLLDGPQTLPTLIAQLPKPRSITLAVPTRETFQQVYRAALPGSHALISLHPLPGLDPAAIQARLARNLLWPAEIHVLEVPLAGIGLAKLAELLGDLASQGWTAEELLLLTERLRTLIRTLYITPATAIPPERLVGPSVKTSLLEPFFGRTYLLSEMDAITGHFRALAQEQELAALAAPLCEWLQQAQVEQAQRFDSQVQFQVEWRPLRPEKWLPDFQTAVDQAHIATQVREGWSPTLQHNLGKHFVELCVAPAWEELWEKAVAQAQRNKIIRTAAERYAHTLQQTPTTGKRRLSDYRVQLK
jgi:hypothetical protein